MCAQVQVTGSGTKAPSSAYLVSFPGAYTASTPGIVYDAYTSQCSRRPHPLLLTQPTLQTRGPTLSPVPLFGPAERLRNHERAWGATSDRYQGSTPGVHSCQTHVALSFLSR
jgi:hypothetical protein